MRMLSGHAGSSSDTARQLAHTIANEGATEPNIDPTERAPSNLKYNTSEGRLQTRWRSESRVTAGEKVAGRAWGKIVENVHMESRKPSEW